MRDPKAIREEVDALRDAATKAYSAEVAGALLRRAAELEEIAQLFEDRARQADEVIWSPDPLARL
jgi:hypothetical protein